MTSIALIDYGLGNIKSIKSAFDRAGVDIKLTRDPLLIENSDGVVLPGVGAFSHGMEKLKLLGLDSVLQNYSTYGKPILGICLGMQMLFDSSDEFGHTSGLGLISGRVSRISCKDEKCQKLPNIGWSEIYTHQQKCWDGTILEGINNDEDMYFVHSFHARPKNQKNILSSTTYSGFEFCSTVRHANIYGCQYHPEKSGKAGLKIIKNFIDICRIKYEE